MQPNALNKVQSDSALQVSQFSKKNPDCDGASTPKTLASFLRESGTGLEVKKMNHGPTDSSRLWTLLELEPLATYFVCLERPSM